MASQLTFGIVSALLLAIQSSEIGPKTPQVSPGVHSAPVEAATALDARDLLNESYGSASGLFPAERAFQLGYLAKAAADIGDPKTLDWAEEGLGLARQLPISWNRLALQENLLIAISRSAPETAMERLCSLDAPVAMDDGSIPEDVRADSAKTIFPAYWQKSRAKGLQEIRHVSVCLGDTGQFPFAAVTPIIADLAKRESDDALPLFRAALGYINRRPEIEGGGEEVVTMLLKLQGVVADWALADGVRAAVARLTTESDTSGAASSKTKTTFTSLAYSKSGTQQYNSRRELLLARLLPEIERLDKSLADKILTEHPALNTGKSTVPVDRAESVTIIGSADPVTVRQLQIKGLERGRLRDVQELAPTDPNAALDLAKTISTPSIRSQAMSAVADQMQDTDPQLAARLRGDARKDLDAVTDVPDRIETAIPAIKAAAAAGDRVSAEQLLRSTLYMGTDFWQQELDSKPVEAAPLSRAFEPLSALVQAGSQVDPVWTVAEVRKLEPLERSYLLISAAQGVHHGPVKTAASKFQ